MKSVAFSDSSAAELLTNAQTGKFGEQLGNNIIASYPPGISMENASAAELLAHAQAGNFSSALRTEIIIAFPPPWDGNVPVLPEFDKIIWRPWDWGSDLHFVVDTQLTGGIGCNGILIAPFVTSSVVDHANIAQIAATGYPAPNMNNQITVCVSEIPGMLYGPAPWTATGGNPNLRFGVGTVDHYWPSRVPNAIALRPNTQYFINVAGRRDISPSNPLGNPTCVPDPLGMWDPQGNSCNIRLEADKPKGH